MATRILSENHSPAYLRECFSYNPDTGILTWKHRPREHFPTPQSFGAFAKLFAGKEAGSSRKDGYKRVNFHGRIELCHRLAWALHYGQWPDKHIDHINQNPSDNRIENLRDVSAAINHRNVKRQANNTSGVCGVVWVESRKAWIAQIKLMGKNKRIGQYRRFEDAVAARLAAQAPHGFTEKHGMGAQYLGEWAKGTAVANNSGEPVTMYHGTTSDIEEFKPGTFFTANPERASGYTETKSGKTEGGTVYPTLINMKNPIKVYATETAPIPGAKYIVGDDLAQKYSGQISGHDFAYDPDLISAAKAKGYDGVLMLDSNTQEPTTAIPFQSEQVRFAAGYGQKRRGN